MVFGCLLSSRWRAAWTGVGVLAAVGLAALPVGAKATYDSPYGYPQTWDAAVRFVRVDNGWKVTEKDEATGYILFEYRSPESPKPSPGSIELVRSADTAAPVRVVVQLARMPHYHEQLLLDSLAAKMRSEYGEPPEPRKNPSPADAGEG